MPVDSAPEHPAPDARRRVPGTDTVMADPRLAAEVPRLGRSTVKAAVVRAQQRARAGDIAAEQVADTALASLPASTTSLTPVINATGVVLHTNLGRAPLSQAAIEAVSRAAGYVDVEFDLSSGQRAKRGRGTLAALHDAVPAAESVLVVNNGAAALVLAATTLAQGKEIVVSRGEMVEIGDGFRLPDLVVSTGARLREVGTTNRTTLRDYEVAVGPQTGCVLKVHPSNFRVEGFTSNVPVDRLATLGSPVVVDIGSGLLAPDPLLPDEPDAATALRDGASVVTASADKLLGGPQGGLVMGRREVVERMRRHPLARALRVDKVTLAALEATLRGPITPTWRWLRAEPADLRARAERVLAETVEGQVVPSAGVVGGGGAPGLELPGWAVSLPSSYLVPLREGRPVVVARVEKDRCLIDLRCVPPELDGEVAAAVLRVRDALEPSPTASAAASASPG